MKPFVNDLKEMRSYLLGIGIIQFLMNNDMQVLYIMESAPEKHRAKLTSITKAMYFIPPVNAAMTGAEWD